MASGLASKHFAKLLHDQAPWPSSSSALARRLHSSPAPSADALRYLPLLGRKKCWTVSIDAQSTEPVGFLPLDSF